MMSAYSISTGLRIAVALLGFLTCLGSTSQQAWSASSQTYDFKVFLGKDEIERQSEQVQKLTDQTIGEIDMALASKEKEIMQV